MTEQEKLFYEREFNFSYSSLKKLLFAPSIFYKEYVLKEKESKTSKNLLEGSLLHCLLFEPNSFDEKFKISLNKYPSKDVMNVLNIIKSLSDETNIYDCDDLLILSTLKDNNLYQSYKKDELRLSKIKTEANNLYWQYINNPIVDVVTQEMVDKALERVEILKSNKEVSNLLSFESTKDFPFDPIEVHVEKLYKTKLANKKFGLKGIVDHCVIDNKNKVITISDLKTTGKSISDFKETVDYYDYWLQAAIYKKLLINNVHTSGEEYTVKFKFIVIDNMNQVYVFDVTDETMSEWELKRDDLLEKANYHYENNDYSLPFEFITGDVKI